MLRACPKWSLMTLAARIGERANSAEGTEVTSRPLTRGHFFETRASHASYVDGRKHREIECIHAFSRTPPVLDHVETGFNYVAGPCWPTPPWWPGSIDREAAPDVRRPGTVVIPRTMRRSGWNWPRY